MKFFEYGGLKAVIDRVLPLDKTAEAPPALEDRVQFRKTQRIIQAHCFKIARVGRDFSGWTDRPADGIGL